MFHNSIKLRVIVLSVVWIALALVCTALIIRQFYQDHIEEHYDAHVVTHLEELIAATQNGPGGSVQLIREPTDPRFYQSDSGWYWEVWQGPQSLFRSDSLGTERLDLRNVSIDESTRIIKLTGPGGVSLRGHARHVAFPGEVGVLTYAATAPQMQIADDAADFGMHLAYSFFVLGMGLAVAVGVQVLLALRPLKDVRSRIAEVKAGGSNRLKGSFPVEIQPLVDELNFLLEHNEVLLRRARNQLSDLAHAVKTPLTVIRNEARSLQSKQGQMILEQTHMMSGSIDHCLSRARMHGQRDAMGYRTAVGPIMADLDFAMQQIYREQALKIRLEGMEDCWFRGEAQDLEEMVGNLLDNACKWANSKIRVSCRDTGGKLEICVDDDGPGIEQEYLNDVLKRGRKLDDRKTGHGQGLSIVRDICQLYEGELSLGRSDLGGLRACLILPAPSQIPRG